MNDSVPLQTLEEMKRYYQSWACEYDDVFNRQGRYDQGPELNARWFAEWDEVFAQLHAFSRSSKITMRLLISWPDVAMLDLTSRYAKPPPLFSMASEPVFPNRLAGIEYPLPCSVEQDIIAEAQQVAHEDAKESESP